MGIFLRKIVFVTSVMPQDLAVFPHLSFSLIGFIRNNEAIVRKNDSCKSKKAIQLH